MNGYLYYSQTGNGWTFSFARPSQSIYWQLHLTRKDEVADVFNAFESREGNNERDVKDALWRFSPKFMH